MSGGWKKVWWRHPLAILGGAVGTIFLFVVLSKLLLILAYLSGGLLFLLLALWLLWRWW